MELALGHIEEFLDKVFKTLEIASDPVKTKNIKKLFDEQYVAYPKIIRFALWASVLPLLARMVLEITDKFKLERDLPQNEGKTDSEIIAAISEQANESLQREASSNPYLSEKLSLVIINISCEEESVFKPTEEQLLEAENGWRELLYWVVKEEDNLFLPTVRGLSNPHSSGTPESDEFDLKFVGAINFWLVRNGWVSPAQ